jgi:hypothetical protein
VKVQRPEKSLKAALKIMKLQVFLLLGLCLLAAVEARPGRPTRRRIRPTPEELVPLPPSAVTEPLPERHTVDPVPIEALVSPTEPVTEPEPLGITPAACGKYIETDIRPLRQQ